MKEEYPIPPELQKKLPYRKRFSIPKGYSEEYREAFEGKVVERVFVPKRTPAGYWYPVIDYIEFNDGSRALRFGMINGMRKMRGLKYLEVCSLRNTI